MITKKVSPKLREIIGKLEPATTKFSQYSLDTIYKHYRQQKGIKIEEISSSEDLLIFDKSDGPHSEAWQVILDHPAITWTPDFQAPKTVQFIPSIFGLNTGVLRGGETSSEIHQRVSQEILGLLKIGPKIFTMPTPFVVINKNWHLKTDWEVATIEEVEKLITEHIAVLKELSHRLQKETE